MLQSLKNDFQPNLKTRSPGIEKGVMAIDSPLIAGEAKRIENGYSF